MLSSHTSAATRKKRKAFWHLYQDLKTFKADSMAKQIPILDNQFDGLCLAVTDFAALNQVLEEPKAKKDKLLPSHLDLMPLYIIMVRSGILGNM